VNIRKYFKSKTLRNFVLFIRSNSVFNNDVTFVEVLNHIKETFKQEINEEQMLARLKTNMKLEKNFFVRFMPLALKVLIIRAVYHFIGTGGYLMIQHNNDKGSVTVSAAVYTEIAGTAATNCFGVKGMAARSVQDGLFHLLRKESAGKGVLVEFHEDNTITIDLHIMVDHGVNLQAVGESIISEVRYVVTKCTGTDVRAVNVYIDSMMIG
jgi:uncharacterized alkaline shock family protein YloU